MKLVVFGASSKSGLEVIKQGLAAGHQIVAFVRDPAKLGPPAPGVAVVQGDAGNAAQVEAALAGQEAVITLIGPPGGGPRSVAAPTTENILNAMKTHGLRRLVVASVAGIPAPGDSRGALAGVIGGAIKLFMRDAYADREEQMALLQASDLDWVAIRLPRLTDDPASGYELDFPNPSPSLAVSRADLAAAMLDQVTDDSWLRKAPIIQSKKAA
ncbi:MAG: NAD(P)H-binding protein [Caldilineales bacterium]